MVRIRRNPLVDAVRRALDSVSYAMSAHDIWTNEYRHPDGRRGVEYVWGFGKDGRVIATWNDHPADPARLKWFCTSGLTKSQLGLVEAHAGLLATIG